MTVICFLPCRKGSERIPRKNIKPFAGCEFGLIQNKLEQLQQTDLIDEIVLTTNDEEILHYAANLKNPKLRLHKRHEKLSSSQTSTDELVAHAYDLIPKGHILWTHVTSPFITAHDYGEIIRRYFIELEAGHDSLMTTTLIQEFFWDEKGPLNYDRSIEKWPRTQTLTPIHHINSAVFINQAANYIKFKDRIGKNPFLFQLGKIKSIDIDWEDGFELAECIVKSNLASLV